MFFDTPFDHWEKWPLMQKAFPELADLEYDNIPRGRVTLYQGRFKIVVGPDNKSPQVLSQIMKIFNLPRNQTDSVIDEHYITLKPDMAWSTFENMYKNKSVPDDDAW